MYHDSVYGSWPQAATACLYAASGSPCSSFPSGIMALVCPIRLDHILNVPVGSMRSIDLFIKVQGCLPKRLFMPLTPIPERLPMICPQSCHFHENTSRPLTRAVRQFFHCSNSFRLATIASMSCSLGLCGASDGWLIPAVGTGVPPRSSLMELFTISRTIVKSCSFV